MKHKDGWIQKHVSIRLNDPDLIAWLQSRQSISDTAREALIRMKQGEELSAELVGKIDTLLTVTEKVDERDRKTHSLLNRILAELTNKDA